MIKVYTAPSQIDAEVIKSFLESHGVATFIQGENLAGHLSPFAAGSGFDVYVTESQAEDALNLLKSVESKEED